MPEVIFTGPAGRIEGRYHPAPTKECADRNRAASAPAVRRHDESSDHLPDSTTQQLAIFFFSSYCSSSVHTKRGVQRSTERGSFWPRSPSPAFGQAQTRAEIQNQFETLMGPDIGHLWPAVWFHLVDRTCAVESTWRHLLEYMFKCEHCGIGIRGVGARSHRVCRSGQSCMRRFGECPGVARDSGIAVGVHRGLSAIVVVWAVTGPALPLLRHLAAGHQHRHDHRHLPDGLPHPEHPEPRRAGHPPQARRADPRRNRRATAWSTWRS